MVKFGKSLESAQEAVALAGSPSQGNSFLHHSQEHFTQTLANTHAANGNNEYASGLPWIPYKELKKALKRGDCADDLFARLKTAANAVDAAFKLEADLILSKFAPRKPPGPVSRALGAVVPRCFHGNSVAIDNRTEAARESRRVRLYAAANATAVRKLLKKFAKVRPELASRVSKESETMHAGARTTGDTGTSEAGADAEVVTAGGMCMFMHSPLLVDLWALEERSTLEARVASPSSPRSEDDDDDVLSPTALARIEKEHGGGGSLPELLPTPLVEGAEGARNLDEELNCAVCLEVVHKPHGLACGHFCCARCLEQAAKVKGGQSLTEARDSARCPQCRRPGVFKDAMALPQLDQLVREHIGEAAYRERKRSAAHELREAREAELLKSGVWPFV